DRGRELARGASAATARRRRRAMLDLDGRSRDVRHGPHPRVRGGDVAGALRQTLLRGRPGRRKVRRTDSGPASGDRRVLRLARPPRLTAHMDYSPPGVEVADGLPVSRWGWNGLEGAPAPS